MTLSRYHQNYLRRSDEDLARRAEAKKIELAKILDAVDFRPGHVPVRVAVLGCADPRFVGHHKRMFEAAFKKDVELTTFDIEAEHLKDEEGAVQHDITTALPNPPYDVAFGHVVLKFIETEKQWDVLRNSFDALRSPGLAIHVFDEEDVTMQLPNQPDGYWSVPIERWKKALEKDGIIYRELHWSIDIGGPSPIRGIKGGALVLIK
ncbi:hypothetical protein HY633_00920 [Candidatus Uhrbacteria bacterium]|nr:hypothetical protein [Candidatus Uhrbacteria bacterium]